MRIGFHVSISGGFSLAVQRAHELGCTCMQIFSRNPRGWTVKPLDPGDVEEFKQLRAKWDIGPVFVHVNYLINLASQRPDLYEKSIEQFVVDLERTEKLGAEFLVTHLGSASGKEPQWMIERVAAALNMAMKLHPPRAAILLENTAGEKGDIGYELEQIRDVIDRLDDARNIGVCYDTCHGFAAGYDVRDSRSIDALARKIETTIGLKRLRGMHLNDCLKDFGSHVDRHWHIGEGKVGLDGFKVLLNHSVFKDIPKIMETPKETEEDDPRNMKTVQRLIRPEPEKKTTGR
ncbi:MAG TPA: deoxyribonuclease IV [Nitrospirota bacterium]|nr:deoxyribonuclease IV [Nitrospirota bacterium]